MHQKIAFLYLNTGGGHVGPARSLAHEMERLYPGEVSSFPHNGFTDRMRVARSIFEDGYRISTNYFEPGYVLFYGISSRTWFIEAGNYLVSLKGVPALARFFRENGITKVVCLHEILILMARQAINRVNPSIPLITLVTDPFTAHGLWFYEKRTELVVFSEKLRREAESRYKFPAERLHVFPFMLSHVYDRPYRPAEVQAARLRLGIPEGRKVLLIAGGGEGLKGADRIVSLFVKRRYPHTLIVVCGRNRLLKLHIERRAERMKGMDIRALGFVSCMPDLLNVADCVITKGGASTVMEVMSVGKPVIFSTFIRGQELGNVLHAVKNGAGWLIRSPQAILDKASEILDDPRIAARMEGNLARAGLRNGLEKVARYIHDYRGPADPVNDK
jgi:UDP-N-acetylglucosamine:LPS N-acetylglucosamine transferase